MSSIFTKIIAGEIPSYKLYEDDKIISILTIEPINPGHALIIPKTEIDHYFDVKDPEYSAVFHKAQSIAKAIRSVTGCARVCLAVQGFEVHHFHLHLIPANGPADFDFKKAKRAAPEELKAMQEKIVGRLI